MFLSPASSLVIGLSVATRVDWIHSVISPLMILMYSTFIFECLVSLVGSSWRFLSSSVFWSISESISGNISSIHFSSVVSSVGFIILRDDVREFAREFAETIVVIWRRFG